MSVNGCSIIAVEGTHASGKTTLAHALVAHYRDRGVHTGWAEEPARISPFIEEIVIHGRGSFDLATEVDLFAASITTLLRAARHHRLLIVDKTLANVVAYAQLLLDAPRGSQAAATLGAMAAFCRAWAPIYDAVVYCADHYPELQGDDPYRVKVVNLQEAADIAIRTTAADTGLALVELPIGLTVGDRVQWVADHVDVLGQDRPRLAAGA